MGGSYFIETLTNETEEEAYAYFRKIEDMGGVIPAIQNGYLQREIAEASFQYQREIDTRDRVIVGVNDFTLDEPVEIPILAMDPQGEERHLERLEEVRRTRDGRAAAGALRSLEAACRNGGNVMPLLLDAVNAYCTLGEIASVLRERFGDYQPPTRF